MAGGKLNAWEYEDGTVMPLGGVVGQKPRDLIAEMADHLGMSRERMQQWLAAGPREPRSLESRWAESGEDTNDYGRDEYSGKVQSRRGWAIDPDLGDVVEDSYDEDSQA